MNELLSQLGVNAHALAAQAVNFAVVLVVLTVLAYRPLTRLLDERKKKIEEGLRAHDEGIRRLAEIDRLKSARLAEAEKDALTIVERAITDAGVRKETLIERASADADALMREARVRMSREREAELAALEREAAMFVRDVVAKTIELDPKMVDEKLIEDAVRLTKTA